MDGVMDATKDKTSDQRRGILAGGNFITDFLKIISDWPEQDALASIQSESMSNGGGPYNVLKDLAALKVRLPLSAVGCVGDDTNGKWILDDCRAAGICVEQLKMTRRAPTSYTDAMTVGNTGRRTFFHQQGANAVLAPEDFDFSNTSARIFLLGFIMLLETLDKIDEEGRTGASRVLEAAGKAGLITAADMVSATDTKFRQVAMASLPYLDVLFLNELEAGRILERTVEAKPVAMAAAAADLLAMGVRQVVVIHATGGAVTVDVSGERLAQGRVQFPSSDIVGSTGAGDAFAAGFLHGWHEKLPTSDCLKQAVCVAACSLRSAAASDGILSMQDCLELGNTYGFADF